MNAGVQEFGETGIVEFPKVKNFRDLLVWQQAMTLVKPVYAVATKLPKDEIYGISSQMKQAAVSVAANIAEGHTRNSTKEFIQFVAIALGSLAELQTYILLIVELNFVPPSDTAIMEDLADKTAKMLRNLQVALRAKL